MHRDHTHFWDIQKYSRKVISKAKEMRNKRTDLWWKKDREEATMTLTVSGNYHSRQEIGAEKR